MGFRLVLKSVILNDLERRNARYLAFFRVFMHLRGIHPLLDYDASESQSMISI